MFCYEVAAYADLMIGFIRALYTPTTVIVVSLATLKIVYFVFKGIM